MKNNNSIHILNILLIAISIIVAFVIPFQLFLIAYAILGPLHYFTEINWLKKNNFFVNNEKYIWILVTLALLASVPTISTIIHLNKESFFTLLSKNIASFYATIIFTTLVISMGLVFGRNRTYFIVFLLISALIAYVFWNSSLFYLLIGVLLPSLIHVYVFTLFFMAFGAIKSKSLFGTLEILSLVSIPFIIILLPINNSNYYLSTQTLISFRESNFANLNFNVSNLIGTETGQYSELFLFTVTGIKIQIFITFAYVYHYLNWFSKVSLIGWFKDTTTKNILILASLWALSVSLYFYDYRLGLGVLFFLSILHVILEFPLNILSIKSVSHFSFSQIRSILTRK